jgi:hypothetical protein
VTRAAARRRAQGLTPPGESRRSSGSREWLWRLGLTALFGAATAWRWAYLARLRHTPFAGSLDADGRIYWDWSEAILRHGPMPPSPFFLAPLYPYALAAWRAIGAANMDQVMALQALLGAAAAVFLADAASRLAGRPAAFMVGVILAGLQPTTFFDGLVLPESLLFFLESVLVWFVARAEWSQAGFVRFAGYGLLVGLLAQGRASHAALLLSILPLALALRTGSARRLGAAAAAVAAFAACGLPSTLANLRASRELIPFTYNLGFNLYVGNNPDANGGYVDIVGGSIPVPLEGTSPTTGGALDGRAFLLATEGLRLTPAASSAAWTSKASRFVRSAPLHALGLAGRKLMLTWNYRELPQIESMPSFAGAAGPLGFPLIGTFGFLAVLGLSGVAWVGRRGPAGRWLVYYLALVSLAMVPFFVTDRYRHHLLPALAVLASVTIAEVGRVLRDRVGSAWVRPGLALGLAAGIVFAPVRPFQARRGDWSLAVDRAIRLLDRGAYGEAVEAFGRAETSLGDVRPQTLSISARTDLAAFYFRYAIALESLGRRDEAIARWERAAALNPNDVASLGRLSLAYELGGRMTDAARVRGLLGTIPGGRGQLLLNDGWSAAGRGDVASAERMFLEALQAAPGLSMAWEGLIRLRIQEGRFAEASRAVVQSRGAGLDALTADIYECTLDLQRGDLATARRIFERIPVDAAPTDPFLARLLDQARRTLGTQGRSR